MYVCIYNSFVAWYLAAMATTLFFVQDSLALVACWGWVTLGRKLCWGRISLQVDLPIKKAWTLSFWQKVIRFCRMYVHSDDKKVIARLGPNTVLLLLAFTLHRSPQQGKTYRYLTSQSSLPNQKYHWGIATVFPQHATLPQYDTTRCVCAVGLDDDNERYINSWGSK